MRSVPGSSRRHRDGAAVLLMAGAHLLRAGVQRYLIDLMERGRSRTSAERRRTDPRLRAGPHRRDVRSVARYIRDRRVRPVARNGRDERHRPPAPPRAGPGEASAGIGKGDYPHKTSASWPPACRWRAGDRTHRHRLRHPARASEFRRRRVRAASYADFLPSPPGRSARRRRPVHWAAPSWGRRSISRRSRWPATSPARENRTYRPVHVARHRSARSTGQHRHRAPENTTPEYYYRPLKTMLVRAVGDGGEGYYVKGHHRGNVPGVVDGDHRGSAEGLSSSAVLARRPSYLARRACPRSGPGRTCCPPCLIASSIVRSLSASLMPGL